MTFEEFFKKKRIDLDALEKGNPALLFEFKNHFEQMGEKSFDHTKKYWFNRLRLQYHLAPEVKTEKPHIENQLAEQTVADSLTEQVVSTASKPGFTPRFKAPAPKPAETTIPEEGNATQPEAKPATGFTPRFKAGVTKPTEHSAPPSEENKTPEPAAENPKGFTPRFKAGVTKSAEEPVLPSEENKIPEPVAEKPKGFTPRFKAGVTKPANPETDQIKAAEQAPGSTDENKPANQPVESKPKMGFTPRFKASSPPKQQDPPSEE